jgi:hypothetical protein
MQIEQTHLIKTYKNLYPKTTLKETAHQTGLNITRIFRLFNGQEMKLSEYLAFQKVIEGDHYDAPTDTSILDGQNVELDKDLKNIYRLLNQSFRSLTPHQKFRIKNNLEYELSMYSIVKGDI